MDKKEYVQPGRDLNRRVGALSFLSIQITKRSLLLQLIRSIYWPIKCLTFTLTSDSSEKV